MRGNERERKDYPQHSSDTQKEVQQQEVRQLIREGGKKLVKKAESLGKELKGGGLTTSQIRNIYGMVKQMEMRGFDPNEFVLLKPKLAYMAARAGTDGAQKLKDALTEAIDEVGSDADKFARFVDFFEAILAYHKAFGGK